jgi:hypothetical protein
MCPVLFSAFYRHVMYNKPDAEIQRNYTRLPIEEVPWSAFKPDPFLPKPHL